MIELVYTGTPQTVLTGQSVLFTETPVKSGCAERHREGSAQLTLVQPGRYLVTFSGNIAIPDGGTVEEISIGLAQEGEVLSGATMRVTPAATANYFNVSTQHYVDVYRNCNGGGCCQTVTVQNNSTQGILVDNPNLTAVRVCG